MDRVCFPMCSFTHAKDSLTPREKAVCVELPFADLWFAGKARGGGKGEWVVDPKQGRLAVFEEERF